MLNSLMKKELNKERKRLMKNKRGKRILLLIAFYIMFQLSLPAVNIRELEQAYQKSELHSNHTYLRISNNDGDDLSAAKLYFSAKLCSDFYRSKQLFIQAYQKSPKTLYGQKAYLECVKIDFLNRDYDALLVKTKKIDLLNERIYWQARTHFIQKKYVETSAEIKDFVSKENNSPLADELLLLQLEIDLLNNKSDQFYETKTNLKKGSRYQNIEAFVLYKESLLLDKNSKSAEAIEILKEIIKRHPQSQYRVFADDLLIELNRKIQEQNKMASVESVTSISQPSVPKNSSKSMLSLTDLEKGKAYIQYALFSTEKSAELYKTQLEAQGVKPFIILKVLNSKDHYALIQGPFTSKESATYFLNNLKSNNINAFLFIP